MVLIDCITLLVGNILGLHCDAAGENIDVPGAEEAVRAEIDAVTALFPAAGADFIIVTNEVGLGIVPDNPLARVYRDLLGTANRMLAEKADEVYLMVSGLPLRIR
jgi:adenosylcobinamide kinase/adenosylcobinamide-phosphate guanylyltransferase